MRTLLPSFVKRQVKCAFSRHSVGSGDHAHEKSVFFFVRVCVSAVREHDFDPKGVTFVGYRKGGRKKAANTLYAVSIPRFGLPFVLLSRRR